jgi:hypothetical protein
MLLLLNVRREGKMSVLPQRLCRDRKVVWCVLV